jgi:hypothetical protein
LRGEAIEAEAAEDTFERSKDVWLVCGLAGWKEGMAARGDEVRGAALFKWENPNGFGGSAGFPVSAAGPEEKEKAFGGLLGSETLAVDAADDACCDCPKPNVGGAGAFSAVSFGAKGLAAATLVLSAWGLANEKAGALEAACSVAPPDCAAADASAVLLASAPKDQADCCDDSVLAGAPKLRAGFSDDFAISADGLLAGFGGATGVGDGGDDGEG